MKPRAKVLPMVLCFSVVLTSSIFLTTLAQIDEESEHVKFSEPVMVSGTLLEADTYKLVWNEPGPQVRVSFIKGSRTVVTGSATLVKAESKYYGAIETKTMGGNTKVLERITFKNKALVFEHPS